MLGYYGTDAHKELQRRVYEDRDRIAATPGLCNCGRFIGIDDPDEVGWPSILALLDEGGTVGFRLIRQEQAEALRPRLAERGYRLDTWDVFLGEIEIVREKIARVLQEGPPEGVLINPSLRQAEAEDTIRLQAFLTHNGIAPFAGWMLVDGPRQVTVSMSAAGGELAAAGHAYLPHNQHSRHARTAWVGMVAVSDRMRGTGLGRYVNALAIQAADERLGAERVYELVSSNEPSRRMVEACGLSFEPRLVSGIAVRAASPKFTR